MAVSDIQSEYIINFNNAQKAVSDFLGRFESQASQAGNKSSKAIESGFNDLPSRLSRVFDFAFGGLLANAVTSGISAATNIIKSGFGSAFDFEAQISSIKALTGATGAELEKIKTATLQAGKDTKFSALEAAQGFEELLKAGVSLDTILGEGLVGSLNLATAGGVEVADAAQLASTALNTFAKDGLSVVQAADILAGSANVSATSVSELKFGLSSVGVVAAQASQSFLSTSTALALFANNGLKGSDAGTSLKTFLNNLIPTTKKATAALEDLGIIQGENNKFIDSSTGKFKSLAEISGTLNDATKNLTDSQKSLALETIFGSDAVRAAGILSKTTSQEFDSLSQSILKIKSADVAKEKLNNLKGSLENLSGTVETQFIIAFSKITPLLNESVKSINNILTSLNIDTITAQISGLYTILAQGNFTSLFGLGEDSKTVDFLFKIRETFLSLIDTVQNNKLNISLPNFTPLLESLSGFGTSFLDLITKIGGSTVFQTIVTNIQDLTKAFVEIRLPTVIDQISNLFNVIASNQTVVDGLLIAVSAIATGFTALSIFSTIAGIIGSVVGAFSALGAIITTTGSVFGAIVAILGGPITIAIVAITAIVAGLTLAWQSNFGGIREIVASAFSTIQNIFNSAVKYISDFGKSTENTLKNVGNFFNQVGKTIGDVFNTISGYFLTGLTVGFSILTAGFNAIKFVVDSVFNGISQVISAVFLTIVGIFTGNGDLIGQAWIALFSNFGSTILAVYSAVIHPALTVLWVGIVSAFTSGVNEIILIGQNIVSGYNTVISFFTQTLPAFFVQGWINIGNAINSGVQNAIQFGENLKNGFVDAFNFLVQTLPNLAFQAFNKVGENITNAFDIVSKINLYDIGSNIIQGLINGINNSISGVGNALKSGLDNAISDAKKTLGIQSPSKVFFQIGGFTGQGLEQGIESMLPRVQSAFSDLLTLPNIPKLEIPNIDLSALGSATSAQAVSNSTINNSSSNTVVNNNQKSENKQINYGSNSNLFTIKQFAF
jgi:trimeric autotransporter adhesin